LGKSKTSKIKQTINPMIDPYKFTFIFCIPAKKALIAKALAIGTIPNNNMSIIEETEEKSFP
jgi:hypothetical protein